jgi:hypothetical protein
VTAPTSTNPPNFMRLNRPSASGVQMGHP